MQPSTASDQGTCGAYSGGDFFSGAQLAQLFATQGGPAVAMDCFGGAGQELRNPFLKGQAVAGSCQLPASLPISQHQQTPFQFAQGGFTAGPLIKDLVQQSLSSHSFSRSTSSGEVASHADLRVPKSRQTSMLPPQPQLPPQQGPPKNAQKRFRERQKAQMQMLEQMLAAKMAEFERLSEANVALKTRTALLEKVVACRDEQLTLLRQFKQAVTDAPLAPGAGWFAPYMPSENELTPTPGIQQSGCFPTAPSVNDLGEPQTSPPLTEAEVSMYKNITGDDLIARWKGFVTQVSSHLLASELQSSNQQAVLQYVTNVVNQTGSFMKHVVLLNEGAMGKLLMVNLETGKSGHAPGPEHWASTIRSLHLTAQQVHDVLSVYSLYRGLLAKVYEERKDVCRAVGGAVEVANRKCGSGSGAAGMAALMMSVESERGLRINSMEDVELLDRLQANLAKERSAQLMLCCFLFGKVLTPVQFARAAVYSYPFFPDSLALCHQMAESAVATAGAGASAGGQLLQQFPMPIPRQ